MLQIDPLYKAHRDQLYLKREAIKVKQDELKEELDKAEKAIHDYATPFKDCGAIKKEFNTADLKVGSIVRFVHLSGVYRAYEGEITDFPGYVEITKAKYLYSEDGAGRDYNHLRVGYDDIYEVIKY